MKRRASKCVWSQEICCGKDFSLCHNDFQGGFSSKAAFGLFRGRIMTWRWERLSPAACRRQRPPVAFSLHNLLTEYVTTWFACATRTADHDLPNVGGKWRRTFQIWLQVGAHGRFPRFPQCGLSSLRSTPGIPVCKTQDSFGSDVETSGVLEPTNTPHWPLGCCCRRTEHVQEKRLSKYH